MINLYKSGIYLLLYASWQQVVEKENRVEIECFRQDESR